MPSVSYTYFLMFLCGFHRNDKHRQLESLSRLEALVYDDHYGLSSLDKYSFGILNMVGICYQMLGDKQTAANYYRMVLKVRSEFKHCSPFCEGAIIRLQLLEISEL